MSHCPPGSQSRKGASRGAIALTAISKLTLKNELLTLISLSLQWTSACVEGKKQSISIDDIEGIYAKYIKIIC